MSGLGVSVKPESLKSNTPMEYATRFLFGGLICAVAGLTAKHLGPVVAGLLLAFPAIFPASATLVEDHEEAKKKKIGRDGKVRGRNAASVDAEGSALGCLGLALFAITVWKLLPTHSALLTLAIATAGWFLVSAAAWWLRRKTRNEGHVSSQIKKMRVIPTGARSNTSEGHPDRSAKQYK